MGMSIDSTKMGGVKGVDFGSGGMPPEWFVSIKKAGYAFVLLDTYSPSLVFDAHNAMTAGLAVGFFQGYDAAAWAIPDTALSRAQEAVAAVEAVGIHSGATIYLDCESSGNVSSAELTAWLTAWGQHVLDMGMVAGIYQGANFILNGQELYYLKPFTRYWRSASTVPPVPVRGYETFQTQLNVTLDGYAVDIDVCAPDNLLEEMELMYSFQTATPVQPAQPVMANQSTASRVRVMMVTVKRGMTVWGLANQYHTTVEAINAVNNLGAAGDRDLQVGAVLKVPME